MKHKTTKEFDKFDGVRGGILAVPYKELQQRLKEEQKVKAALPKRSHASIGGGKKREGGR